LRLRQFFWALWHWALLIMNLAQGYETVVDPSVYPFASQQTSECSQNQGRIP
jgi:hypothetical protein